MPIYEYKCEHCGQDCELLVNRSAETKPACPGCGSTELKKKISKPAASACACGGSCGGNCGGCGCGCGCH